MTRDEAVTALGLALGALVVAWCLVAACAHFPRGPTSCCEVER